MYILSRDGDLLTKKALIGHATKDKSNMLASTASSSTFPTASFSSHYNSFGLYNMVYGTSYAVMERASIDMDEKEDSNASNKRRHYLKVIDIKAMSLKKKKLHILANR